MKKTYENVAQNYLSKTVISLYKPGYIQ